MTAAVPPDYYAVLGVPGDADTRAIARAFRQKALKCHPDKVAPDDTAAAAQFLLLNKAYETLVDPSARAKHDAALDAEKLKKAKFAQLDESKRKMRQELEEREKKAQLERERKYRQEAQQRAAKRARTGEYTAGADTAGGTGYAADDGDLDDAQLQVEIERLRQDGLAKLRARASTRIERMQNVGILSSVDADMARVGAELGSAGAANVPSSSGPTKQNHATSSSSLDADMDRTLRVKWSKRKHNIVEDDIVRLLSEFGNRKLAASASTAKSRVVEHVLMSTKGRSAYVLVDSVETAANIINSKARELEHFEIDWARGREPDSFLNKRRAVSATTAASPALSMPSADSSMKSSKIGNPPHQQSSSSTSPNFLHKGSSTAPGQLLPAYLNFEEYEVALFSKIQAYYAQT